MIAVNIPMAGAVSAGLSATSSRATSSGMDAIPNAIAMMPTVRPELTSRPRQRREYPSCRQVSSLGAKGDIEAA